MEEKSKPIDDVTKKTLIAIIFILSGFVSGMIFGGYGVSYGWFTAGTGEEPEIDTLPPGWESVSYLYVKTQVTLYVDVKNYTFILVDYEQTRITTDGYVKTFRMGGSGFPSSNVQIRNYCEWTAPSEQYPDAISECSIEIWGDEEVRPPVTISAIQAQVTYSGHWDSLNLYSMVRADNGIVQNQNPDQVRLGLFLPPFPAFITLFIQEKAPSFGYPSLWGGFWVIGTDHRECHIWIQETWRVLDDPAKFNYQCHPIEVS